MNELASHGSTSARKESRRTAGRARKPRDTPHAWLRRLTCPFDFGLKVTKTDPETGKASSRPIHCNKNRDILAAFRDDRRWMFVDRLSNAMLDAHWRGEETFYFAGPGSSRCRFALFNFDIDCHASGSPEGAFEAAEYLRLNFFPGLYHEPSTNGRGRHGYFILDKEGLGAEDVKRLLKALERYLNPHLLSQGFDIELFEVKGLPPVLTWNDGEATNYTAGVLAKVPRQVHRFEEWKRTTVMTHVELRRLVATLRPTTPATVAVTPKSAPAKPAVVAPARDPSVDEIIGAAPASGSTAGKVIGEGELAQLVQGGRYREVAASLLDNHSLKTTGRSVVTVEDVAVFLLCLKFFTNRMNADGTLPVKRFEGLWSALYEAEDVGRAFDCHRFKAIRDYLSGLGLLDWEDHTFVAPREGRDGTMPKGRACKWKAGEMLMGMLGWENDEGEAGSAQGECVQAGDVQVVRVRIEDVQREEGGEGEAPLVGTRSSTLPLPTCTMLAEAIRTLARVPVGEEIRPVEVLTTGQNHPRLYTPEFVTRMVLSFEESMERLAA